MGAMADTARTAHRGRIGIAIAAFIVTALLVVPLVWPVPPLEDTLPPTSLAGPDSLFIEIDGVSVHYEAWGIPPASDSIDTAFVLLHGFGASTFSWREVAGPLSERMPVVAFDRPAFGLTERPLSWTGANPYSPETQAELTVKLMDELGIDRRRRSARQRAPSQRLGQGRRQLHTLLDPPHGPPHGSGRAVRGSLTPHGR